mgnify:CR=1 FL=1|jgi:hypothetical protein
MKIIYQQRKGTTNKDYILVGETQFCCDDMKEAWDDDFIGFGEKFDSILNYDHCVNIYKCHPYPEGACWITMGIKYCPFCREEIKIEQS